MQNFYENPHTPLIRVIYGGIISFFHFAFFVGYGYLSFLIFQNSLPIVENLQGIQELFKLQRIELIAWVVLTIFYSLIFLFLGTLSAISSIEYNLSKPNSDAGDSKFRFTKNYTLVAVSFYLQKFQQDQDSIHYDEEIGMHRIHNCSGLMVAHELGEKPKAAVTNLWGFLNKPKYFQFINDAHISFIQPVDISRINHHAKSRTQGYISSESGSPSFAHLEIMTDGVFLRKLEKDFDGASKLGNDSKIIGHISIHGYLQKSGDIRVSNLNWLGINMRSSQDFADDICSYKYVPENLKSVIQEAIINDKT